MRISISKVLKFIVIVVLLVIVGDIIHEWNSLNSYNQAPLKITTFDGSNSPYHPSVRYFEKGWNGYKYWMTETPFYPYGEPYRDRNECPCIHVSNDGLHWSEISANPIDDLDSIGVSELDYFSDPHLVQNGDTLECWYRLTKRYGQVENRSNVLLLRKKTADGIHWTQRDTLINFKHVQEKEFVSPAIQYNDSVYDMWYADNDKIFYMQGANPKDMKNAQLCVLKGYNSAPWHIDVIKEDSIYWLLCYDIDHNELTLWNSSNKIEFNYVKTILVPSDVCGSFYQSQIYRSCMLKVCDNNYRIYFSANNLEVTSIGLMEGSSFEDMKIVDIDNAKCSDFLQFLNSYFTTRWRSVMFIVRHFNQ